MFAKSIVAVALLSTFAAAQTTPANYTLPNPAVIDATKRGETYPIPAEAFLLEMAANCRVAQWCSAEESSCPMLCGGLDMTTMNECDVVSSFPRYVSLCDLWHVLICQPTGQPQLHMYLFQRHRTWSQVLQTNLANIHLPRNLR
jgi:hypothetical protein